MLSRGSEYGVDDAEATERITAWTARGEGEFAVSGPTRASPSPTRRPASPPC